MRIESGATSDERIRGIIFLLMCVGFMGWFAYDGLYRYPQKNLAWALQALPEKPADARTNRKATVANLNQLIPEMTRQQMEDIAGPPALRQDKRLLFVGPEISATLSFRDNKVTRITTDAVSPELKVESPNFLVRPEKVAKITTGMSQEEVIVELGKPTGIQEETLWYIGPAAFASIRMIGDKCAGGRNLREATEYSETDILGQRAIAGVLVFVAIWFGLRLYRVFRLHVVLDDAGLQYNRLRIPWDAMQSLGTEEYLLKGWVDLAYTEGAATRTLRLDSYRISRFSEILAAICERKGFAVPTVKDESSSAA